MQSADWFVSWWHSDKLRSRLQGRELRRRFASVIILPWPDFNPPFLLHLNLLRIISFPNQLFRDFARQQRQGARSCWRSGENQTKTSWHVRHVAVIMLASAVADRSRCFLDRCLLRPSRDVHTPTNRPKLLGIPANLPHQLTKSIWPWFCYIQDVLSTILCFIF